MTRVGIEAGAKRVFASALDWPGWARGGRDEAAALALLADYAPRYAAVATSAGLEPPELSLEVVERQPGGATTDFGAPGVVMAADRLPRTRADSVRLQSLLEAAWRRFDQAVAEAPLELRKGPRGGGRDRDRIRDHVTEAEAAYLGKAGSRAKGADAVRDAFRELLASESEVGAWPIRYAVRRVAWHLLDHAWEIGDRT